ncbi:MAG: hypothetical protein U1F77_17555 [Kiritimatiellia bacterium]
MNAPALASLLLAAATAPAEIPYPDALDAASVSLPRISNLEREALVVGNGDLNALVWERNGAVCLRVAKNDIWDARIDTSADPALMKVDLPGQKWQGGGGNVPSWNRPYPSPVCAGIVRIGGKAVSEWTACRAGGRVNEWKQQTPDGGVMAIEGAAGASAGFQTAVPSGGLGRLRFKISGTPGARYYVTLNSTAGGWESGWKDSPAQETAVEFRTPSDAAITGVLLYIMTSGEGRAENRIREITLDGGGNTAPVSLTPGAPAADGAEAVASKLDLRRALATAGKVGVRALAGRNVLLIETEEEVSLEAIRSGHLPAAEPGETDGVKWLHQKMPGDLDYPGMEYAMAVAGSGGRKAVAVVTTRDLAHVMGGEVRPAAVRLARQAAEADPATLVAEHEAAWAEYWSASGVKLADPDFEAWWYRMLYLLRCFSKPGVVPAGLWALQPTNAPNWHGDYHHNYNAWQPYWTGLAVNHPEQAEPWVDYMNEMLPRLKWFAKETYGCEGAFVGISSFAFEPDPAKCRSRNQRQIGMVPWGYTMGMIGMSSQILWWHHLHRPDRAYLEAKIYPVVREAALFFCSFAEKCPRRPDGRVKYGPSYSPEHGGFGVHDVPFDLAYARFSLQAGIAAARELGRDPGLVERFQQALALLPGYPTAPDAEGRPVVVDWTGCGFRQIGEHNITVPAVPVFPAEQVTFRSPESERELFRNTLRQTRHRGCNSTIMLSVAKARLDLPAEAVSELRDYYKPQVQPNGMFYWPMHGFYLAESVGVAAGITEFLLQSVDDPLRVFPAWPRDRDARFTRLRARGGFLVGAGLQNGGVTRVTVLSESGRECAVMNPWPGKPARITRNGAPAGVAEGGRLVFPTAVGETLELSPGP